MATNFASAAYVAALQTLLDRHEVPVTVSGFREGRQYDKMSGSVAELMIESFRCEQSGELRTLDGVLTAGLLVMRRLNDDEAEEHALELAFDVATALVDEVDFGGTPVMAAGPIMVTNIEPEQPDGALQHRVAAFLVTYEQQMRIRRTNQIAEPDPLETLYVSRTGEDGYRQLVPAEE